LHVDLTDSRTLSLVVVVVVVVVDVVVVVVVDGLLVDSR
jgi:hypothetical protein